MLTRLLVALIRTTGVFPLGAASSIVSIVLNAGLVTPVNFGLFLLGESLNLWVDCLVPLSNKLGVLLVSPFGRFLWGEAPALEIVREDP
jgi:hypothetical protein